MSKIYAIELKIEGLIQEDNISAAEIEETIVNELGLTEMDSKASWELNIKEYENIKDIIKNKNTVSALAFIDELTEGGIDLDSAKECLEVVENIEVKTDLEIKVCYELQQKIKRIIQELS